MDVSAVPCVAWGVHRVGLMKRSVSVAMRKIAVRPAGRPGGRQAPAPLGWMLPPSSVASNPTGRVSRRFRHVAFVSRGVQWP
jgi:uncharacterized protein with LGFP repeats